MNKLVWSQFNSSLIHNLQQYQAKEKFCDTTVVCEKKFFQLHRVILSNCSDYFEDIFDKTPCKHPFIVLKDVTAKEFKLILDFIYRGEVEICQSELNKFLDIAKGLKIRGIKTATVLISEKHCENGEVNKIDNKLSHNDSDIVEVGKHSKSFTKKKRKLDVESLTRHSNEEDDIQFEFIRTKSRNKKKIKYEKSNENSKQTTFEVAVVKEKME
ncbi:Protein bric-a-brac 2 [Armadillidium nasatum]|uniref:Protein bric-a-brac 2 n=2 Tax=Armadillidium nasatum TaxID=96803 RepID=A0A5N5T9M4_9CRUS|nr:Protein bric-a-brac 2 [Armadillidium nasatum]